MKNASHSTQLLPCEVEPPQGHEALLAKARSLLVSMLRRALEAEQAGRVGGVTDQVQGKTGDAA